MSAYTAITAAALTVLASFCTSNKETVIAYYVQPVPAAAQGE